MKLFECFKKKKEVQEVLDISHPKKLEQLTEIEINIQMKQLEEKSEKCMRRAESFSEKGELHKAIVELRKRKVYKMEHQKLVEYLKNSTMNKSTEVRNPIQITGNI